MRRILGLAFIFVVLAQAGCKAPTEPHAASSPRQRVTVARVVRRTVVRTVELPGDIRANLSAQLYAKVAGYLESVKVDKGDRVRAGQVLARIRLPEMAHEHARSRAASLRGAADAAAFQARLPQTEAQRQGAQDDVAHSLALREQLAVEVRRARAALEQATAELTLSQVTYSRLKGVYDEDNGALAQEDLDAAESRVKVARGRVDEARASVHAAIDGLRAGDESVRSARSRVREAQAQVEVAREEARGARMGSAAAAEEAGRTGALLGYTEIVAPFDGTVTDRLLDPGALVQAADNTAQSATTPVLVVDNDDVVRVRVQIPQEDSVHVRRGTAAHVRVDAWPDRDFGAPVSRVADALSAGTRTMLAEVDVRNTDHALKPGMFAQVTLDVDTHVNAIAVPTGAVLVEKNARSVFVVDGDRVHKVAIKVGYENKDWTEVVDGLKGAESVVVSGKEKLSDGAAVGIESGRQ